MSSLKFIMDVEVDHDDPPRENKKLRGPSATIPGTRVPDPSAYDSQASPSGQGTHAIKTPAPIPPVTGTTISSITTTATRNQRTPTAISSLIEGPPPPSHQQYPPRAQLVVIAPPARQPSALPGQQQAGSIDPAATGPPEANFLSARPTATRRHSTTSANEMDQHGYSSLSPMMMGARGGPGRASSLGGIGDSSSRPSNMQNRPVGSQSNLGSPLRLTPITGRVSRAKKGQPVHVCDICRPAKTFTRAEHLRRHQLGHETPKYPCLVPGCGRSFHRPDLLARHQQKHQEGDSSSAPSHEGRRRRDESPSSGSGRQPGRQTYSVNLPSVDLRQNEASSSGTSGNTSGSGSGLRAHRPASSNDMHSTSNINQALQQKSFGSSPTSHPNSHVSTHDSARRSFSHETAASRRISQDLSDAPNSAYTLSPTTHSNPTIRYPTISTSYTQVAAPVFNQVSYEAPRVQRQLCVVTEGLAGQSLSLNVPDAGLPDLSLSPMYQSSTDGSTYSTPSELRAIHDPWVPRHSSPAVYPGLVIDTSSSEAWNAPYVLGHGPQSPHSLVSPTIFSGYPDFGQSYGYVDSYQGVSQADHLHMDVDENTTPSAAFPRSNGSLSDDLPVGFAVRSRSLTSGPLAPPAAVLPASPRGMNAALARRKKTIMMATPRSSIAAASGAGLSSSSSSYGSGYGFGSGDDGYAGSNGFTNPHIRSGFANNSISLTTPLPKHLHNSMSTYEAAYWDHLDPDFPFVHRGVSDEAGGAVLLSAMAAAGAQHMDGSEHRGRSGMLYKHAWEEVRRIPQWNLQKMQAILLCEYLTRFRGKRLVMQPSRPFESLYSRVIDQAQSLLDLAPTPESDPCLTAQQRWSNWLAKESYRRLAASCFILDVHASLYHQSSRSRSFNISEPGSAPHLTFAGRSQILWDAGSATEWDEILAANPAAGEPMPMLPAEAVANMLPQDGSGLAKGDGGPRRSFDQLLVLAAEMLRLPKRKVNREKIHADSTGPLVASDSSRFTSNQGPYPTSSFQVEEQIARLFGCSPVVNTYLALHHTPLHDLLAVSGTPANPPQKSLAHQQVCIRLWTAPLKAVENHSSIAVGYLDKCATRAVVYAARSLASFLFQPSAYRSSVCSFTDYWGIYVCALICWACGTSIAAEDCYAEAKSNNIAAPMLTSSGHEAREWLNSLASLQPGDDNAAVRAFVQDRRWAGVVGLARRQIERDCSAGSSGGVVSDVVAVLKRLDEDRRKRF